MNLMSVVIGITVQQCVSKIIILNGVSAPVYMVNFLFAIGIVILTSIIISVVPMKNALKITPAEAIKR